MFTRKDYLEGRCSHRDFYGQIVERAGLVFPSDHALVQRARRSTDPHYNDIPLALWGSAAVSAKPAITRALKETGDFWSLAGGVCTIKEAVRRVVERT